MSDSLPPLNGLSLDRLRNFLAFAEKGSIAKVAPASLARQALISRQIGELEQYFSTELTVRRGKTLALSEAGENLANLVRSQFQDLEEFQKKLRGQRRTFSIGAGASVLEWLVNDRQGCSARLGALNIRLRCPLAPTPAAAMPPVSPTPFAFRDQR